MKNMMMLAMGVVIGVMLTECKMLKKPIKCAMKKINID